MVFACILMWILFQIRICTFIVSKVLDQLLRWPFRYTKFIENYRWSVSSLNDYRKNYSPRSNKSFQSGQIGSPNTSRTVNTNLNKLTSVFRIRLHKDQCFGSVLISIRIRIWIQQFRSLQIQLRIRICIQVFIYVTKMKEHYSGGQRYSKMC